MKEMNKISLVKTQQNSDRPMTTRLIIPKRRTLTFVRLDHVIPALVIICPPEKMALRPYRNHKAIRREMVECLV